MRMTGWRRSGLVAVAAALAMVVTAASTSMPVAATAPPPSGQVLTGLGDLGADQKSIATLTDGTLVAAGNGYVDSADIGVFFLLMRPDGSKITPYPVRANARNGFRETNARVVPLADGHFVVVWVSGDPYFDPTGTMMGRKFDHTGYPLTGDVPLSPSGVSASSTGDTQAVPLVDDGFAILWNDSNDRSKTAVFNADLSPRHQLTVVGNGYRLIRLSTGGYAASTNGGILFFGNDGTPGPVWPPDATRPFFDMTGLADGSLVGVGSTPPDPSGHQYIFFVHLDSSGRQIGGPTTVSDPTKGSSDPAVSALSGGGFVITWATFLVGLLSETFSSSGTSTSGPTVLAPNDPSRPTATETSALAHDGFAVIYNTGGYEGAVQTFQGDPTAAHSRMVQVAYQVLLGRDADQGGLGYWTSQLDNGLPYAMFMGALAYSAEGRSRVIVGDYMAAFGRAPDPGGLTYWSNQLTNSGRPDQIEAQLFSTPEAYAHAGSTPAGLIGAFYRAYLLRQGDPSGLQFWTDALNRAGNTPSARSGIALLGFQYSSENLGAQIVGTSYNVCGRPPATFGQIGTLANTYLGSHRDPALLTAQTLATVCPPDN